jgi:hypothetical protein
MKANQKNNRFYRILLVFLSLGLISISVLMVFSFAGDYRGVDFEKGSMAASGFIAYLVVLGYKRSNINLKLLPKNNPLLLFSIFFFMYSSYHTYVMVSEIYPSGTARDRMYDESWRVLNENLKDSVTADSQMRGDFEHLNPLAEILNKAIARGHDIFRQWESVLNKSNLNDMLTPQTFNDLQKLIKYKASVAASIARFETLTNDLNLVFDDAEYEATSEVNSLLLQVKNNKKDTDFLRGAKDGVIEGVKKYKPLAEVFFETEISVYKKYYDLLVFFEARQGEFSVSKNEIFFEDERDMELYTRHFAEIQALSKRKNDLVNELRAKGEELLKKYEDFSDTR